MTLAKEINEKLDEMLLVQAQINEIKNDLAPDAQLNNTETGEVVTKDFVLDKGRTQISQITKELNKITNNGSRGRNIFTNPYYINDRLQDRLIAKQIKANN